MNSSGFPPIAGPDASVLILGTLPGQESLRQQQYYAQSRNAFWPIMGRLLGFSPALPYGERAAVLAARRVALWDVCAAAYRPGSLDASIAPASIVVNDFAGFLAAHPGIGLICFNGAKAADLYRRKVGPGLPGAVRDIPVETLPSTSPAHAGMSFETKLARWSSILLPALGAP